MAKQSSQSTDTGKGSSKPAKPYKGFPLFAHDTGRWAKKIRGKLHYFGRWGTKRSGNIVPVDDVEASAREAVDLFNAQRDDLFAGRTPRPLDDQSYTMRDLCNEFLTSKLDKLNNEEISQHTFSGYQRTCARLIDRFGRSRRVNDLGPDDFAAFRKSLANGLAVVTLKNEINRCRIVFKYAFDQQKIDKPVPYGQSFDKPSSRVLRKARNASGPNLFQRDEVLRIIDEADPLMSAMVLLAINGGLGNTDVAELPKTAIDFSTGWLEYPRPKTEVHRRIPLWPKTLNALRSAIDIRPAPSLAQDDDLCFITNQGNRWVRTTRSKANPDKYVTVNTVAGRFGRLLKKLKINGRKRLGFYTLRHTFETIAGESRDQVAVDAIMGHIDNSMAAVYREGVRDERLKAVTETVYRWLFGPADEPSEGEAQT